MPAAALAAAAVGSSAIKAYSANKAAGVQQRANATASALEQDQLHKSESDFNPFIQTGQQANTELGNRLQQLTAPITMDEATLAKTPGYQFNQYWGQKGIANSAAARGLASSGLALKEAGRYASGLADNTYQNQFNNANINNTNAYNRLLQLSGLGETSANNLGQFRNKTGQSVGSNAIGAGNAEGAASVAIGNDVGNGLNSAVGNYFGGQLNGLYGSSPSPFVGSGGGNANNGLNYSNFANGGSPYGTN